MTVRTMVGLAIGKISYLHPETKQTERKKFFDGLIFDRVIPGVMIQGGDLLGTGVGHPEGPGFPYKSEIAPALKFDAPGAWPWPTADQIQMTRIFLLPKQPIRRLTENIRSGDSAKIQTW